MISDEIIEIVEIEDGDTIDITVEDTHMFFANDIYTHNSGFNAEVVDTAQMGGNIKRAQKTHFLMSVAKTMEQKQSNTANIQILKARFVQDGHIFKDCIFSNDSLEIRVTDDLPERKRKVEIERNDEVTEEDLIKNIEKVKSNEATKKIHDEVKSEMANPDSKIKDIPDTQTIYKTLLQKGEASQQIKNIYAEKLLQMRENQGALIKEEKKQ